MKKRLLLLIATGVVLFANSKIHAQNFVQVTRTNQEQTINLSTNQVLEVQLPKRPSNGYTWVEAAASSDKVQKTIAQIGDGEFIHNPNELKSPKGRPLVGQAGTEIIRYVGASQGTTVLTLELRRPWVKNGEVIDSYTITVVSAGKYTGTYTPPVKAVTKYNRPVTSSTATGLPSRWDWRSQCTSVTNQGSCGDCWAFASVGTLECNILIHDGVTKDISEEYLTDCDNAYNGCGGGACAHDYWLSPKGAVYESEDPWNSGGSSCGTYAYHETIDSYADIGGEDGNGIPTIDSMKYHIYYHGPIWVAVAADNAWYNYTNSSGIWAESSTSTDHAICLVGWCDTTVSDGSGGYWILRNSWDVTWGYAGYMYITYGSDAVGTDADYIVYKGGAPHNAPPVANFTASSTSSCTPTIQFYDKSTNTPNAWSWTFGDGGTSTLQNPSHTYTANGSYNISLTATNGYGDNTYTQTGYITINMPESPTVTGGSAYSGGSVTLTASGSGTLNWYNAATGGSIVNTGTSYTINPLMTTEIFYVESDFPQPPQSVGMSAKTSNATATCAGRQGITFDTYNSVTIDSVTIYASASSTNTIFLETNSGTGLDSLTTTTSGTQILALNWTVPVGTGYILGVAAVSGGNNLYRETSGASFPYSVSGVISLTGTTYDTQHYYYFYNWKVSGGVCESPRIPVTATVLVGINEYSEGNFDVFPNPNTGSFDIKLNDQNIQNATVSIANMLGQTLLEKNIINTNAPIHIDAANLSQGMYYVRIQTEKSTYKRKVLITN
ncbi:MAG: C1 family peptidase [Bacteroidales bacterium]|jgi:PKD repeat protein/predicted secreted protein